jgi:hypothetical protein
MRLGLSPTVVSGVNPVILDPEKQPEFGCRPQELLVLSRSEKIRQFNRLSHQLSKRH